MHLTFATEAVTQKLLLTWQLTRIKKPKVTPFIECVTPGVNKHKRSMHNRIFKTVNLNEISLLFTCTCIL